MIEDIALTVVKSHVLPNWWLIEPLDGECFGSAAVEGYASEMLAIADSIERELNTNFRRCAIRHVEGGCLLWSPRNSDPDATPTVPYARALELAKEIRAKVTPTEMP